MININDFDSNLLKIDKSHTKTLICIISDISHKKSDCENIHIVMECTLSV